MVKKLEAVEKAEAAKLQGLEVRDPEQEIARSEADVRARQAMLDRANRAVEEYRLKAPADGTILSARVNPGEVIGLDVPHAAIQFCPSGRMSSAAEVEQEYANRVALNTAHRSRMRPRAARPDFRRESDPDRGLVHAVPARFTRHAAGAGCALARMSDRPGPRPTAIADRSTRPRQVFPYRAIFLERHPSRTIKTRWDYCGIASRSISTRSTLESGTLDVGDRRRDAPCSERAFT